MRTEFLLLAKYDAVTLTLSQVADLIDKAPQTVRNRVALGTMPPPTSDGVWRVQDIAAYLDCTASVPKARKAA